MEDLRESRRFGARHRTTSRMQTPPSQHPNNSTASHSHTSAFSAVANERSVSRPISSPWNDESTYNFNFETDNREHPPEGPHPDKYISTRPKASGQSISAPGSSFTHAAPSSSLAGVTDAVLSKNFMPAKNQGSFLDSLTKKKTLENLTKKNTLANRGPGNRSRMLAYTTPSSSLEIASAPVKDISNPHVGTSGWVDRRPKVSLTGSKPRVLLTTTEKRLKPNSEWKTSPPVVSHYALRDRNKTSLLGHSPTSRQPFTIRGSRSTRLGKRKMNSEGSAAKPISLDSDSDSELKVQSSSAKTSKDIVEEVPSDTRKRGSKKNEEEKPPADDLETIAIESMMRIHNCDVMIGLFQCVVDLFIQGDRMCIRDIRGKHEKWPFKGHYLFYFAHIHDVRLYSVSKEVELDSEIDIEEGDKMEQLLDEASYMAFKIPLPNEDDQAAMQSFYDPTGSDVPKGYIILRPLEDASGVNLDDIKDHLRCHTDVHPIDDKEQAKEHLQVLMKDPFSYKSSGQGKSIGADAESHSESEEDDVSGSITVLAYPLPPCTSDVVTIIRSDVSRLKPRRYLNDNIIDYYFKRLMLESFRDNEIVQEKVLFLNSHFYTRLRAGKGPTARDRMEAGYKNVSTWLARSNFFNRSIIFIPINKDVHWSLAVILNPGIAGSEGNDEEAFSCIAVLDPLGSYHRKAAIIRNLRAFLRMEWGNSHGRSDKDDDYGVERVLTVNVKTPIQENSYDCGVYVLKFAEVILKSCLDQGLLAQNNGVIGKDVTDEHLEALITSNAFSAEDITATRKQIRQYIEADTIEYQARRREEMEKVKASKVQQQE